MDIFPRVRGARATRAIKALGSRTPARVSAAVLRTWLDCWCTQIWHDAPCIFCQRERWDDLEHMPHCALARGFSQRSFGIRTPATPRERNTDFLLLGSDVAELLVLKAIRVAALYHVHCKSRSIPHSFHSPKAALKAVEQAAKEAVMGHAAATRVLDRRWREGLATRLARRPRAEVDIVPAPRRRRLNA